MVDKTTDIKLKILALYRADYATTYHVRAMATLLKKSHVTLLPHLKALEKDKILTQKTVGKNKVYSLNLSNILAKSYLLLAETVEAITCMEKIFLIKKLKTELSTLQGSIVLFGSYAKRTFDEESDIDILYIGEKADVQRIKRVGKTYGKRIQVQRVTQIDLKDPLLKEIVKHHVLLHNPEPFINALWRYYYEIR